MCIACPKEGHLARTCNKRHETSKKKGCKQFHTTWLQLPDNNKLNAGIKRYTKCQVQDFKD